MSTPTTDGPTPEHQSFGERVWRFLVGRPKDLHDPSLFKELSLIPFLAWVGLGADGLSSSAYGPAESYAALGTHRYLAVALAALTAITVIVISAGYRKLIEDFPQGGGYVVATRLLGPKIGLISGCALFVDYALTVTTSIASTGDALFSLLPPEWGDKKLAFDSFALLGLMVLNMRGVKEAILPLVPVFLLFLATHVLMLVAGFVGHASDIPREVTELRQGFSQGLATIGFGGMLALLARAWSLGGGTYTGIEAVSNGMSIMREPRVKTAQRTMVYMAASLTFMASGLLLCYLAVDVKPVEGKTLNAVLAENALGHLPGGSVLTILTLVSEGALLVIAAQAGFIGGPRVLANMALDGWAPRRFAALSERLTTQNGILLIGGAAMLALWHSGGDTSRLLVMYSINVFLTFSLAMIGMLLAATRRKPERKDRKRRIALFAFATLLCLTILSVTVYEKFLDGGWLTLVVTGALVYLGLRIRQHYKRVSGNLVKLSETLTDIPGDRSAETGPLERKKPVAAILVGSYGAVGIHTLLNAIRLFPQRIRGVVFLGVGAIDSQSMHGEGELTGTEKGADRTIARYVDLARRIGLSADGYSAVGTDVVDELAKLCSKVVEEFADVTFFAGQLVFDEERWYHGILHNGTAYAVQKRVQQLGKTLVILPFKVNG